MKLKTLEHNNILFQAREKTSDEKTFDEVIVRNVYEKRYFKIKLGEHWIDLGGNVGAFTLNAISKGATIDVYEPDPFNCKMIEKNLKLNNMDANIHNLAVVGNDMKKMTMYVGNNMQVWRNSLYKNWGNQKFTVKCINFNDVIKQEHCVKMDIEGAEMPILESMTVMPKKMVFEWSFDIDKSYNRYRKVIDRLKPYYKEMYYSNSFYDSTHESMPSNVFPKADNIYCL